MKSNDDHVNKVSWQKEHEKGIIRNYKFNMY